MALRRAPRKVCFVCTANMCRSAMAHAVLAARAPGIEVVSCGTDAWPGAPATGDAMRAVAERGYSLADHAARADSHELLAGALVLCMTRQHRDTLARRYPDLAFHLLRGYAARGSGGAKGAGDAEEAEWVAEAAGTVGAEELEVHDPVGTGLTTYRRTLDLLEREIEALLELWR